MDKTYAITYRTGKTQIVKGNVSFFSSSNTSIHKINNAIYLNSDEVISVIEQSETEPKVENKGEISDGYHTFNELYYHRMILFSIICNQNKERAWKSWLHDDGTMYDDYFIVGITTGKGDYTYHYHKDNWDFFNVEVLEKAPKWDGHKPEDITRLFSILSE